MRLAAGEPDEVLPLFEGHAKTQSQRFRPFAGWPAFFRLDLADCYLGIACVPRKVLLSQVQRLAASPEPFAK